MKVQYPFDAESLVKKWLTHRDLPKNDFLKQPILQHMLAQFGDRVYTEDEVNDVLREHFDDHVLVRRELVNFGYMQRDPYKGEYRVVKRELSVEDVRKNTLLARDAKDFGVD